MIADLKPYPAMKDPGVEWLGDVPEHWEVRQLARIGRFSKGNGGTKEDEVADGVPCVRYGDLYTKHQFFVRKTRTCVTEKKAADYTLIQHGDVLFAGSGETIEEIGKSAVNLISGPACCGGDVIIFRPSIEVDASFFGYATDCPQAAYQKSCMGRGITVMHIYGGELQYMFVGLPPLPEQAAIVRYLDYVDRRVRRLVRAKQKLIGLLEEQKQAIIHCAVTRGLDPNVPLKPSGVEWLGDVPEHWEVRRLGRLIKLTTGFPFKSEGFSQSEGDIRLLRGVNISPGRLRWNEVVRWPPCDLHTFSEFEVLLGDIVLGMDRPIIRGGIRVASVTREDVPSLLLQRVARIRPLEDLDARLLLLVLAGRGFIDYLTPIFTGISVPHLSPEQIRSFRMALPPLPEQATIVENLGQSTTDIDTAIDRARREIALLREYRTRLIADVVTGKLDVREAAAKLPDEPDESGPLDEADVDIMNTDEEMPDDRDAIPEEAEA